MREPVFEVVGHQDRLISENGVNLLVNRAKTDEKSEDVVQLIFELEAEKGFLGLVVVLFSEEKVLGVFLCDGWVVECFCHTDALIRLQS